MTHQAMHLSMWPSIHPTNHPPTHSFIYPFSHPFQLCNHLSIHPSLEPSMHQAILPLTIHPPMYWFLTMWNPRLSGKNGCVENSCSQHCDRFQGPGVDGKNPWRTVENAHSTLCLQRNKSSFLPSLHPFALVASLGTLPLSGVVSLFWLWACTPLVWTKPLRISTGHALCHWGSCCQPSVSLPCIAFVAHSLRQFSGTVRTSPHFLCIPLHLCNYRYPVPTSMWWPFNQSCNSKQDKEDSWMHSQFGDSGMQREHLKSSSDDNLHYMKLKETPQQNFFTCHCIAQMKQKATMEALTCCFTC